MIEKGNEKEGVKRMKRFLYILNSMTDQATITNAEARNAIAWCANNNIVGGKTNKADGTKYFDPKASATRAQFTKILVGAVTQNFLGK